MIITTINFIASALLGIQAFVLYSLIGHKDEQRHIQAFLVYWGLVWVTIFIYYLLSFVNQTRPVELLSLSLDTISNFSLAFVAYVLFKGKEFSWSDRYIKMGYGILPVAIIVTITVNALVTSPDIIWRIFYTSPNILMAAACTVAVGIALFKEPAAKAIQWPILIIFIIYAFIQIPSYYFDFIDTSVYSEEPSKIMGMFRAAGKFTLLVLFSAIAISAGEKEKAESFVLSVKLTTWVLTVGFALFVFLFRAIQAIDLAKTIG